MFLVPKEIIDDNAGSLIKRPDFSHLKCYAQQLKLKSSLTPPPIVLPDPLTHLFWSRVIITLLATQTQRL